MSINPLLLSVAAPAALNTLHAITATAADVGRSFAQVLAEPREQPEVGDRPTSFAEQLQTFESKLKDWLGQHGIANPYEISLNMTADGQEQLEFSGQDAERIAAMLDENPGWLDKFRQLANRLKAGTGLMSGANISLRVSNSLSAMELG